MKYSHSAPVACFYLFFASYLHPHSPEWIFVKLVLFSILSHFHSSVSNQLYLLLIAGNYLCSYVRNRNGFLIDGLLFVWKNFNLLFIAIARGSCALQWQLNVSEVREVWKRNGDVLLPINFPDKV